MPSSILTNKTDTRICQAKAFLIDDEIISKSVIKTQFKARRVTVLNEKKSTIKFPLLNLLLEGMHQKDR